MSRSLQLFDKVVRLCESRGFSIESCLEGPLGEAYTYHFGPLGTELRRNFRNAWWHDVVRSKANVYGFETNSGTNHAPNTSPRLNDTENGQDQGKIFNQLRFSDKCSVAEDCSWTSEDTDTLTSLVRFIPGIQVPFGMARNIRYLWKPENDKYILRSCEKEVMTLQFFCTENRVNDWLNHWKRQRLVWWRRIANVRSNYSLHEEQSDLGSGVDNQTFVQYAFPWGQETVDSLIVRSDLHKHMTDEQHNKLPFNKESVPHVIQIKTDLNRGFLSFLMDAYSEKERSDSNGKVALRTVLHLHPHLAPVKVAVLLQIPQQSELRDVAQQLSSELRDAGISTQCPLHTNADQCYAYQDEIGTPYCITILETTLNNGIVMFRNRNTTLQEFIHVSDILSTVKKHLGLNAYM